MGRLDGRAKVLEQVCCARDVVRAPATLVEMRWRADAHDLSCGPELICIREMRDAEGKCL